MASPAFPGMAPAGCAPGGRAPPRLPEAGRGRAGLGACGPPAERQLGPYREAGPLMSLAPAQTGPVEVTPPVGLTSAEVAERRSRGLAAGGAERTSRPVAEILRANILTRFNGILGVLLAVILLAGEPHDALLGIVLVANALIGIGQELRAKLTLDRLAVLSAPTGPG